MWHIIQKDIRLFLGDLKGLFLYLLLPVLLISIFVLAYSNLGKGFSPVNLLVVNKDKSEFTTQLLADLDSLSHINIYVRDSLSARKNLNKGAASAILWISENVKQCIENEEQAFLFSYDTSNEMEFGIVQQTVMPMIFRFVVQTQLKKQFSPDGSENEMGAMLASQVDKQVETSQATSNRVISTESISSVNMQEQAGLIQGVVGTAVLMLLFGVRSIGAHIIEEKENGTLQRTLFSSLSRSEYLTGKLISSFIVAFIQLAVMFLFSALVFGFDLSYNFLGLFLITSATVFACAGLSIFIGVIVRTRVQLQSLSTIIILAMSAIGGSMVPFFIMPAIMRKLAVVSLNYWSIQAYFDLYLRNLSIIEILPRLLILSTFGLVSYLLALAIFSKRLSKFTT